MSVEEAEEIQAKGIDNLSNRIIAENFPKNFPLRKRVTQVQEAYRTPNHQDQKRNTPRHIIKTLNTQNKERKLQKRKDKSLIKANPLE
jgi:hypothetical protein